MHEKGDKNTEEHAKKNFQPGMAKKFHKTSFRHAAGFKEFINNLIQNTRLHARGPAHALGIKHDHKRKGKRYCEKRIGHSNPQRH